jgi:hypothetical protein
VRKSLNRRCENKQELIHKLAFFGPFLVGLASGLFAAPESVVSNVSVAIRWDPF